MKLTDILKIFKRAGDSKESGRFSRFFLNAPADKKKAVLEEAARMSNEQQQTVFRSARLKIKTS